mmetsp:Transcript_17574/g.36611  ORF Transcript_17574/g.36611 Transcript_17574/m.36611 type:complete len:185 (-) Transcript_17574:58-612(-)
MVPLKSREESEADLEKLNEAYHKLISSGGKYDASKLDEEKVLVHCQTARRSRRKKGPPPSNCTAIWRVKDIPEFLLRNASKEKKCEALAMIPMVDENNNVGEEVKKWDPSQMLERILRFEKNDRSNGHVNEDDSDMFLIQDYLGRDYRATRYLHFSRRYIFVKRERSLRLLRNCPFLATCMKKA